MISFKLFLSNSETRILFEYLFRKEITQTKFPASIKSLDVSITWKEAVGDYTHYPIVICRFGNGMTYNSEDNRVYHTIGFDAESIKNIPKTPTEEVNIVPQYEIEKKFHPLNLFTREEFIAAFLQGNDIAHYFKTNQRWFSITNDFQTSCQLSETGRYMRDVLEFLNLKENSSHFITLTYFISQMLRQRITIIRELRPSPTELAKLLFELKDKKERTYIQLLKDFGEVFNKISFEVRPVENKENERQIWMRENEKEFLIEETASGHYAGLFLLYNILGKSEHFIIFDEPETHFHPSRIIELGKRLMKISENNDNQIMIITHSPLLLDFSIFSNKFNQIIYVKKQNHVSKAISGPCDYNPKIISHHFKPEIFFEKCSVLVEGPSDEYTIKAISDANDNVLKKESIALVNTGGKDQLGPYIELHKIYGIPYVGMADNDYKDDRSDVIIMCEELEDEIERLGWKRKRDKNGGKEKISAEQAYEFIFDLATSDKNKLEQSKLWKVVSLAKEKAR
jgi:predicted ATPase